MRTTPFLDSFRFLLGDTPDHLALGSARFVLVLLYAGLLLGSIGLAAVSLSRDPAQRNGRHAAIWLMRVLLGTMWLQGSLWKLPLPVSGGFEYWTGQLAEHAAYSWHAALVRDVLLPGIRVLDPFTWALETAMAAMLMLGIAVRLAGLVGILFMLNLWLGLYRSPAEWPWNYLFCAGLHWFMLLDRAGRSWGVDGLLARRLAPDRGWERLLRWLG